MDKPNFFIVGAPKTGTTSLYHYLIQHPKIFICDPKEPFYFDPRQTLPWMVKTDKEYLDLFRRADYSRYIAIGEGSTTYLSSPEALQRIQSFNPSARIIVMLRNPIEIVQSLHNYLYYKGIEDFKDLETAWQLQTKRAQGLSIPKGAKSRSFLLQYAEMAMLGKQLQCLYEIFSKSQIKVIVFDDFKKNPHNIYVEVLQFLDVPDDGKTEFKHYYETSEVRYGHQIIRFLTNLPEPLRIVKERLGLRQTWVMKLLRRLLTRKAQKEFIPEYLYKEMVTCFNDDVKALGELLHRDLNYWLER